MIGQKSIAAGAIVVLVVALVAATVLYRADDAPAEQSVPDAREDALASLHSPTMGAASARVHIVEFLDPACGTCALFFPMVKQWLTELPDDLRLSVRHVAFHTGAEYAIQVLEASRQQDKYWQTLEALLASQQQWVSNHVVQKDKVLPAIAGLGLDLERLQADMNSVEVMQRMERDKKDSILLKVSATPDYYVNGRPLPSFGQQQLLDLVREELQKSAQ